MIALLLVATAAATPVDSTRWIVSNHGREAGELVAVTRGDSTVVRWVFTDRNRGTRVETRQHRDAAGRVVRASVRPVLADGTTGEPTDAFAVTGDSVRRGVGTAARMALWSGSARAMAERAARRALEESGVAPGDVTHVITASCTGFESPGVDAHLIESLSLRVAGG